MPTYEFRCPNGHDFERFFKTMSTAASEVACPECGEMGARQLSAGAGLMFKGSGFYLTDYGKNAHRSSGTSKGGDKSGDAKPDSAKSDAPKSDAPKADAKADTKASAKPKAESSGPAPSKSSKPKSSE